MASRKAKPVKLPVKLSADERATFDRIHRLSKEERANLPVSEMIAYVDIVDKLFPGTSRRALENVLIDQGLTNAELFRLLERAMRSAKSKH